MFILAALMNLSQLRPPPKQLCAWMLSLTYTFNYTASHYPFYMESNSRRSST